MAGFKLTMLASDILGNVELGIHDRLVTEDVPTALESEVSSRPIDRAEVLPDRPDMVLLAVRHVRYPLLVRADTIVTVWRESTTDRF